MSYSNTLKIEKCISTRVNYHACIFHVILPRDAYAVDMHSWIYAMARCLSVCPAVTRRYCIETAEQIQLLYDTEADLGLCYVTVIKEFRYVQK